MAGQLETNEVKLISSDGLQNKILSVDLNGNVSSSGTIKETASSTPGYFGSIQSSWNGSTSYPTLYGDATDRWVMHINPHISYTQNGVNGFTGTMTGATIRMAGQPIPTSYWDIGVGTNSVGTDTFSIGRSGYNLLKIDSSGRVVMPYQLHIYGCPTNTTSSTTAIANYFYTITSRGLSWGSDRITVPIAGVYLITFNTIGNNTTGRVDASILVNGTQRAIMLTEDSTTGHHYKSASLTILLAANDYIQFSNNNWYNNASTGPEYWRTASVAFLG